MVLLVANIVPYPVGFVRTHTEKGISVLPMKQPQIGGQRFHEFLGVLLEDLQNLDGSELSRDLTENVDVIGNASDDDVVAVEVLKNSRLIAMNARADVVGDVGTTFLRGKDDVNSETMKGLWHTCPENGSNPKHLSEKARYPPPAFPANRPDRPAACPAPWAVNLPA